MGFFYFVIGVIIGSLLLVLLPLFIAALGVAVAIGIVIALPLIAAVLVLLGIPSALLLAVSLAAPEALLEVVFHHQYTAASDALAPLVVAMILLSVSVVLTMYLLAVGRRWVAGVSLRLRNSEGRQRLGRDNPRTDRR